LQAVPHQAFERRRKILIRRCQIWRPVFQDRVHRLDRRLAFERPLASEHLIKDRAQREEVRAMVCVLSSYLLGRHVTDRPHDYPALSLRPNGRRVSSVTYEQGRMRQLGETKVENLDAPVSSDKEILRLQIAMHNSLFVRGSQSARGLQGIVQR